MGHELEMFKAKFWTSVCFCFFILSFLCFLPFPKESFSDTGESLYQIFRRDPETVLEPAFNQVQKTYPNKSAVSKNQQFTAIYLTECFNYFVQGDYVNAPDASSPAGFSYALEGSSIYLYGLHNGLVMSGYPTEVWKSAYLDIRNALVTSVRYHPNRDIGQVHIAMFPHENKLKKLLEDYRKTNSSKLPVPIVDPFCGGDSIGEAQISTDPPGGRMILIPTFYFQLCQKNQIDPYSPKCERWRNLASDQVIQEGSYNYSIHWDGGVSDCYAINLVVADQYREQDRTQAFVVKDSGHRCKE